MRSKEILKWEGILTEIETGGIFKSDYSEIPRSMSVAILFDFLDKHC